LGLALAKKAWPQLGFHQQHYRGVNGVKGLANDPTPVKRKVKDPGGFVLEDLPGKILPG
jgi:hypothetical protein